MIMMKYNFAIGNIGKALLIIILMIAWVPLITLIISYLDSLFLKENTLIGMGIIFLPPIGLLTIWISQLKNKDVFQISDTGIESETHGIIRWEDIRILSWESFRGSIGIYLILKDRKRLMISPSSQWRHYDKGFADLKKFFDEIHMSKKDLLEKNGVKIANGRLTNTFNTGFVIFLISFILVMIIINLYKK